MDTWMDGWTELNLQDPQQSWEFNGLSERAAAILHY